MGRAGGYTGHGCARGTPHDMTRTSPPPRPLPSALAVLLCLLLPCLVACGGGGGSDELPDFELPPFYFASSTPYDTAVNVPLDQSIVVKFNKPVDPATVDLNTLDVRTVAGEAMSGTVLLVPGGANDTIRWTPVHDLAAGSQHEVTIAAALRSVDDEPLGGASTFRFYTAFPSPPGFIPTADQLRASLGQLNVGRQGHRATLLLDGRVLVTGGFTQNISTTDRAEVYLEGLQRFDELAGRMVHDRASHSATRLADGRVLLAGGWFEGSPGLTSVRLSAELFDPATSTFTQVGDMTKQRADHAAVLLPDGRVLITGGSRPSGPSFLEDLDDAEVFDPGTGQFTALPARMTHTRTTHGLVPSTPGFFVLGGGSDADFRHGRFSFATMTFEDLGAAASDRGRFGPAVAAFDSGGVLIAGGDTAGTVVYVTSGGRVLNTGSGMNAARSYATAVRIDSDRILVAGGIDFSRGGFIEASIDLMVEGGVNGSNTYGTPLRFTTGMAFHAASPLPSGDILFCGGLNEDGSLPNKTAAFLFDVR